MNIKKYYFTPLKISNADFLLYYNIIKCLKERVKIIKLVLLILFRL